MTPTNDSEGLDKTEGLILGDNGVGINWDEGDLAFPREVASFLVLALPLDAVAAGFVLLLCLLGYCMWYDCPSLSNGLSIPYALWYKPHSEVSDQLPV